MIALEQIVRTALLANSTLSALIGTNLYLVQLPQNPPYPCMVYQRISTRPITTMNQLGDYSAGWQGMGWARFQFTAWANGSGAGNQTDQIARALQGAMNTFDASQLPGSPAILTHAPNLMLNRIMTVEPQTDPPLFKAQIDFDILYMEQ